MFSSILNLFQKPSVAVRVPNDEVTFNPKEWPNVAYLCSGNLSGKIRVVHDTDAQSDLGQISVRIWVVKEEDLKNVTLTPSFHDSTVTLSLQVSSNIGTPSIYHETILHIPRSTANMASLFVKAPNTTFSADALNHLVWGSLRADLSNGCINFESARANAVHLKTSNSPIQGSYEAGHVDLETSNSMVSTVLRVRPAWDGVQSKIIVKTSNAHVDVHLNAEATEKGLWLDTETKNGKMTVGALLGKATQSSCVNLTTSNGKIELNLDASQTSQDLECTLKTSNASNDLSVMVPQDYAFWGKAITSNAPVRVNLTEAFEGTFSVETSNSPATVEGTLVYFEKEKKNSKAGYRGHGTSGPSSVELSTSNAPATLKLYPVERVPPTCQDGQNMKM